MRRSTWMAIWVLAAVGCEDATKTATPSASPAAGAAGASDGFESALTPEDQVKVVAKIGGLEITLKEFERRLKQQAPYARARYASLERKKEFLDNLVRFEVLASEAATRGYDQDPDVIQQMKQTMVRKLMTQEVKNLVKLSDISEETMKKYYEENSAQYHKPEQVRVSHILVGDSGRAKQLHRELSKKIAGDRRSYRKLFADYARKHSEDVASKPRGGDLRFFARSAEGGPQAAEVSEAAFALAKVGDLSAPTKSVAGWLRPHLRAGQASDSESPLPSGEARAHRPVRRRSQDEGAGGRARRRAEQDRDRRGVRVARREAPGGQGSQVAPRPRRRGGGPRGAGEPGGAAEHSGASGRRAGRPLAPCAPPPCSGPCRRWPASARLSTPGPRSSIASRPWSTTRW